MTSQEEFELVKRAVLLGGTVTGCCEWHERAFERVQRDQDLLGLTPEAIRQLAIAFVSLGGMIEQVQEKRPEYNDFDFYYKTVVPVPGFPHGLFVEMRLHDADAECPVVLLVNAHAQWK
jgi:hypothetical protein